MEGEEEKEMSLYPMYYGVSCAFVALQLLAEKKGLLVDGKWSAMAEIMLQGSAKLLGLLVWKAQGGDALKASSFLTNKLENTEQGWVCERKKLRMQIQALENELRLVDAKHKHLVASLHRKIREKDQLLESKEKDYKKVEEELQVAVMAMEEMRKSTTKESSDVWKQKASFIHDFEAAKQELLEVMERKAESDEMVKELTSELAKLQKDAQQNDRILSAMFRKSKLDVSEKLFLRKTDNSVEVSGSNYYDSRLNHGRGLIAKPPVLGSLELECGRECGGNMVKRVDHRSMDICSGHSARDDGDIAITTDIKQLEDWVRIEAQKYTYIVEQRHHEEIAAFIEQMRLKDEKLEAHRWQLLSMELESKRLESYIVEVGQNLADLREKNMKLEALLMDREQKLKLLKEKFSLHIQVCQKSKAKFQFVNPVALWSEVKISQKNPVEESEEKTGSEDKVMDEDEDLPRGYNEKGQSANFLLPCTPIDDSTIVEICEESLKAVDSVDQSSELESQDALLTTQAPEEEIEEEKEIILEPCPIRESPNITSQKKAVSNVKLRVEANSSVKKNSPMKMDLHALGVSYKIKRLKQQLLMLEKITGGHVLRKPINEDGKVNDRKTNNEQLEQQMKEVSQVISFLTKQVKRYQGLEEKVDSLCQRLQENGREVRGRDIDNVQAKKEVETLTHFLEETFQLQRYMVATGQKLKEVQSKIDGGSFLGGFDSVEECKGFDMRQFAGNIKSLFGDVQRGLEIRIARIIGDLEGTLACEGILQSSN